MTLRTKLTAGFLSVLLLAALASGLALWSLREVSATVGSLTQSNVPTLRSALLMRIALHEIQTQERLHMLANDDDGRDAVDKKRLAAVARYQAIRAEVAQADADGRFAADLKAIDELMARYLEASKVVLSLSAQGNSSAANSKLSMVSMPLFAKMSTLMDRIAEQAGDAARTAAAYSDATQRRGVNATLAGVAAMLLVSGVLAWRIPGSVLAQIGAEPSRAVSAVRRIAAGDFQTELPTRPDDRSSLLWELKAMQSSLAALVLAVRRAAGDIDLAAAEVASGNLDLSQRTERQAGRVQLASGSLLQLGETVSTTADSARSAAGMATSATDVVRRGHDMVKQVQTTMSSITEAADRIADITGAIDGIAFQTNILALNAAVEAARAGEQGRGFAVVAAEVRSLAQRSAAAAREIKTLIADSGQRVEAGGRLVGDACRVMDEVVESFDQVRTLIGSVSGAAAQQGETIRGIAASVGEIDESTQQNAALVEQSAAAAASMKAQADRLTGAIRAFQVAPA